MSEPPSKPARRRMRREGGNGPEDGTASMEKEPMSTVAESKSDVALAAQMAEEKKKSNIELSRPNSPMRGQSAESDSKERGNATDNAVPPERREALEQKSPSKSAPPKKAPKPVKSLEITGSKSEAEEKDEIAARSKGKKIQTGMLQSINSILFSQIGYRMEETYPVSNKKLSPYTIRGGPADTVWALSVQVLSMLADTTGLVKPAIKVHAVYKESGMYVKSMYMPPVQPVSTTNITLDDVSAGRPVWNQNLLLAAHFQDVVDDETLLLFEVLDLRPTLQTTGMPPSLRQPKRIAWAYLVPVSGGKTNVGICPEWKNKSGIAAGRGDRRQEKGAAGAGANIPAPEEKQTSPDASDISSRIKRVKLQLYHCVEDDGIVGALQRRLKGWPDPCVELVDRQGKCTSYPDGIPSVYLQWRRHHYEPIPHGFLCLELGPQETQFSGNATGVTSTAVNQDGSPQRKSVTADALAVAEADLVRDPKHHFDKAKSYAIKRLRAPREPCTVPDKVLHRLKVGPEGAMVVQFSHSGHLLAVGAKCNDISSIFAGNTSNMDVLGEPYSLQLFNTDSGEIVWSQENAHHGIIYSISWSIDNSYLLTASGDGTVKVWDVSGFLHHTTNVSSSFEKKDGAPTEPFCLYSHTVTPPAYMYAAVFQEYVPALKGSTPSVINNIPIQEEFFLNKARNDLPRVIAGGSDGRLRVWDHAEFKGYISVEDESELSANDSAPCAHNGCRIQALTIDSRSRYLISGDSEGNIFVWRHDSKGWYQLLRRFKQDEKDVDDSKVLSKAAEVMQSGGVQSLTMNADKTMSQVLVLNQCPSHLKLYSTSTYKPISNCSNVGAGQLASKNRTSKALASTSGAVYGRATLSPDGRFAVTGVSASGTSDGRYRLKVWEVKNGNVYPAALSEINLPYPVRSISWHPEQHVMAVAMVGSGAAVVVYSGERESAEIAIGRMASNALDANIVAQNEASRTNNESVGTAPIKKASPSKP